MRKFTLFLLVLIPFFIFGQTEQDIQLEASPIYQEVVDNSEYSLLWKNLVELRKSGNETEYFQVMNQLNTLISNSNPEIYIDSAPMPVEDIFNNDNPVWSNEILVYTGDLGTWTGSNPYAPKKMIKSFADTLGTLYVAFTTNFSSNDQLKFFKSTDKGYTWTNFFNLFPGTNRKFQAFDADIADTTGGWKIGVVMSTVPVGSNGNAGTIYYADFNDDGTGYAVKLVQNNQDTKGYISPAIVTDGFNWSPSATYWYLAYQEVDSTSGLGSAVIAALSSNGGTTWKIDTARATFNDYDLDIDYNFRADSIYVLLTNNLTESNPNLRMRYINLGGFGTTTSWKQYNPANTGDPEYDGMLATCRKDSSMAVLYTIEVSGNKNLQYSYTTNGIFPMNANIDVAATELTEERGTIHSPATQKAYRIAYVSDFSGQDTVIYRSTTNIATGFGSPTIVTVDHLSTGLISPSVIGIRNGTGHSGGVFFAGNGPTDLYFNGSNIVSDINDNGTVANDYLLNQNYPNPFNPNTKISFSIPEQTVVKLKIFNAIGQEVATVINTELSAGNHSVDFNAASLSSGVYFYRIESPNFTSTKKMILMK